MDLKIKFIPTIGIDARPLSHGITGNSRYLFETIKILSQREKSIFSYHLFSNKPINSEFKSLESIKNIKISIHSCINGFFWFHFYLKRMILEEEIDMFWGTLQLLPLRKLDIPCFVNYHDLNFYKVPETMTTFNYFQHLFLSTLTLNRAEKVFCLSHSTAKDICDFNKKYDKKLDIVYPGVSKKLNQVNNFNVNDPYFLTVGTIEPRKNIRTIVDVYLEIKRKNPNFSLKLIIAGKKGWNEKELQKKLLSGKLKSQGIEFIENPSDKMLESLYEKCSFFIFPSIHEGFGLPILEAKKYNKLCIVSKIPVFSEIVDDEDIMVAPYDKKGWEKAILSFSNKESLSRKNNFDINQWSWNQTANQLEKNFRAIWKKKTSSLRKKYEIQKKSPSTQ